MRILSAALLIVMASFALKAQPFFPENGPLYDDSTVPRIDISIDPEILEWLYQDENLENDTEFSARFVFNNGEIIDTIEPIGFRLRGNTSRYSEKKSFKVSFNSFTQGGKYYGVEKLNLNGEHNDPSVMRSKLGWDLLRKWGIAAPRSNHVEVYINGDYYGLYINVEHIDEEFVKSRYAKNDGNLFKCLWPADLDYLGSNPDAYKLMQGDRRVYQLKTNKEADDYSDLANFINVLNNTSNFDLVCQLDEVFNVYDYLKVVAMDILTGNWDGPIYNKNNFYLYHNTSSGKFEYIPYDLDNTFGIDWFGIDWGTRNIYNWSQGGEPRPIYTRLMENDELRNQFSNYIKTLVETSIDFDSLNTALISRRNMLLPYISKDNFYEMDYGFTTGDFLNSLSNAFGKHVKYGISQYLEVRKNRISLQVEQKQMNPIIKYIQHQKISATEIWIGAQIEVSAHPAVAIVEYSQDGTNWQQQTMYDDGMHNDGEAGDYFYGSSVSGLIADSETLYQIYAEDANANNNLMPCNPVVVPPEGESPLLFINEFMASNKNTIADEHGNYGDWIELYNGGSVSIWLGDKYLTDNLGSPGKWQMPDHSLAAGEFVLFWADGNPNAGDFHTNFKLSKDGEEIGIFSATSIPIDEKTYGQQESDISFGRKKDGNIEWVLFDQPTPGSSNSPDAIEENPKEIIFSIFPNPSNGGIVSLSKKTDFKVLNIYGQLVEEAVNYDKINTSNYTKGVYIVVSSKGFKQKLIIN